MELLIVETIDDLYEDLDYEEVEDEECEDDDLDYEEYLDEDEDEYALPYKHGYVGEIIEVEDGDTFKIRKGTEGQIYDDNTYFINVHIIDDLFEKEEIVGNITAGTYRLEGDLIIPVESDEF